MARRAAAPPAPARGPGPGAVRCASPPESVRACRRASPAIPNRSSHAATRRSASTLGVRRKASPMATLSRTVASARSGSWNTLAIRRRVASAPPGSTARPWNRTAPAVGAWRRPSTRSSVDLPAPLGPITASTSCARTASAGTSRAARPSWTTRTSASSSTGPAVAAGAPGRASGSTREVMWWAGRGSSRGASYTPARVAADVEHLVHEARHLDLEVPAVLGGRALAPGAGRRGSGGCTMCPGRPRRRRARPSGWRDGGRAAARAGPSAPGARTRGARRRRPGCRGWASTGAPAS